jgi:hypothetical protein
MFGLTILGCFYPQRDIRSKLAGFDVVTLISVRTIDAIQVDFVLIDRDCMSPIPVRPACRELDLQSPILV